MLSFQHQPVKFLGLLTVILDGRLDLCIGAMVEKWCYHLDTELELDWLIIIDWLICY